jgi:hypothetical protein
MIMTAADAMRLPRAQLTEDEHAIVEKLVSLFNAAIPERMKYHGFEFETNNTNPDAQLRFNLLVEEQGWQVQCQPLLEMPRFQGASPVHTGYKLVFIPTKAAIDAARSLLQ